MTAPSFHTAQLQDCLQRMRAGDQAARNELVNGVVSQMERLARRMLRGFPNVARWADTDDVLQNALVRLLKRLEKVEPESLRGFLALAAVEIRRELLDLARHFYGPHGLGTHYRGPLIPADSNNPGQEPAAPTDDPAELEAWTRFHEEVEKLPDVEREVIGLIVYHGWTQVQVAELFGVTDRTVRTWWQLALLKLRAVLGDALPSP